MDKKANKEGAREKHWETLGKILGKMLGGIQGKHGK